MKIAILGAGAMGSLYGAFLSRKEDVTLLDVNQELIDHINENGMKCLEKDGTEKIYHVKAEKTGTNIGIQDLIIVFVKGSYTKAVIEQNMALIDSHTLVMTLQNGAGNNRDIAQFVDKDNILVGTSNHNSVIKGLGVFYHSCDGVTNIGPDVRNEENVKKAEKIAEMLERCGFETHVMEDIQRVLWNKLFLNCGINGLTMLTENKMGAVYENPYLWSVCQNLIRECIEVAKADGTHFTANEVMKKMKNLCVEGATGVTSMYQDRMMHRKTEIDRINGAIVGLAHEYGISAPYNEMLVQLVHAVE